MVCKMASLGFVSAQALPNISLISNAKSVSRSRLLADSAPAKIYLLDFGAYFFLYLYEPIKRRAIFAYFEKIGTI